MRANLPAIWRLIAADEGALDLDPRDRGNWTGGAQGVGVLGGTRYGVASHVYSSLLRRLVPSERDTFPPLVRDLTEAQCARIFEANYWQPVNGDGLPSGVDYAVVDFAYNSGTGTAARALQRLVGADPIDGIIGPKTLAVVRTRDTVGVVHAVCDARVEYLRRLANPTYEAGWLARVERVRAQAERWAAVAA